PILNQAIGSATPGLGNAGPILYALAQQAPDAFHDITSGTNCVPCSGAGCPAGGCGAGEFGYAAAPGYDLATGIGSIDAYNLVEAWKALNPTGTTLMAAAG